MLRRAYGQKARNEDTVRDSALERHPMIQYLNEKLLPLHHLYTNVLWVSTVFIPPCAGQLDLLQNRIRASSSSLVRLRPLQSNLYALVVIDLVNVVLLIGMLERRRLMV